MLKLEQKQKIVKELIEAKKIKGWSNAKISEIFNLNKSQVSRILNGETERVLSDDKFLSIARKLDINLKAGDDWQVAKTATYSYIYKQLEMTQELGTSGLLCDRADIGKTFTAKHYVKHNANSVYIDCSLVKSKQRLVRRLAQEFGLDNNGKYADVLETLIFYLNNAIENPLIILDEAGDLAYPAFLELKTLWNSTEHNVGWYMMGADGLRVKIERYLANKKVGYAELFSRFGSRYQRVTPEASDQLKEYNMMQIAIIAKANGMANIQELYRKTEGSLRRAYHEIRKSKINK